jgi:hypothetical protein
LESGHPKGGEVRVPNEVDDNKSYVHSGLKDPSAEEFEELHLNQSPFKEAV